MKKKLGLFFPKRQANHLYLNPQNNIIGCLNERIRLPMLEDLRSKSHLELIEDFDLKSAMVVNGKVYANGYCLNELDRLAWYYETDRTPGSYDLEILKTLARDVDVICDPYQTEIGYDKYKAHMTLLDGGVRVPEFALFDHRVPGKMIDLLNGWGAAVLKPRRGAWGKGVTLIDSEAKLRDSIGYVWSISGKSPDQGFFLERFYENDPYQWASLTMVNGEIVQGYRKKMSKFQAFGNGQLKVEDIDEKGGEAELADLKPEHRLQAHKAYEAIGLGLIGFDMIWTEEGPMVIDENTSPGNYLELYEEEGKDPAKIFSDWITDGM